ncbi:MAG: FtsQ-type POTRA domain-containing protein [Firmicutes bacterium]|nr:FtsQ-type POTRA domain-containing protein [Bacillota bacterium]
MSEQIDKIKEEEQRDDTEAAEEMNELSEETEADGPGGSEEENEYETAGPGEDPEEDGDDPEDPEEDDAPDPTDEEAEETEDDAASWEEPGSSFPLRGKKRSRKHKKKHRLLRLAAVIAIIAALVAVANLSYFDIKEIPVIGNKAVSDEDILKDSQLEPGKSIFFVNPWLTKSRIKKNLLIEDVKIDRKLPTTVEIIVTERDLVAQFVKKSKQGTVTRYVVTDQTGMVVKKYKKKRKVTMVDDLTVTKAEPGKKIEVKESGTYRKSMELIRTMREGDLYFKEIKIQGSRVTAYIYDDLVCKGRYRNLIHMIKSGELKAVVYRLYQQDVSKGTINIGDNNYCSFTPEN